LAPAIVSSVDSLLRRAARHGYRVRRRLGRKTRAALLEYDVASHRREAAWALTGTDRNAWILDELRRAVRYAAEVTFWRRRFEASGLDWSSPFSFADYARLPTLERHEIAGHGEELLHPGVPASDRRKMATGGSSGEPTVTWTGPRERGWVESAIDQSERRVGVEPTDRRVLFWGHSLDPVTRSTVRERVEDWVLNRSWLDCFRMSREVLLEYHESLQRKAPDVVVCYASALVSLAQVVEGLDRTNLRYPRKAFITGAEKLYSHQRELIQRVFGRPVYERYGGRDLGLVAWQQDTATTRLDVDWANIYAERETATADTATLLITKLHADAMPMFRYRSGDIVRAARDHAFPGPLLALDEVVGRELQNVLMPDGNWIHPTVVPHLMKDFNVAGYQLHQLSDFSIELLICPAEAYSSAEEAEIVRNLSMNFPGLTINVRHVSEIPKTPAGKVLPVISDVARDHRPGAHATSSGAAS
jgi:phenylacetate-CoA ligase